MIIQPKGFKRERSYAALMIEIKREIEQLAAKFDCSKSYVIATLLADQLNIKSQPKFYEQTRITKNRRYSKITRIESGKRRTA